MTLQQQQKQISSSQSTIPEPESGIDFIFKHFVDYLHFPRKISTFNSNGAQFPVLSKNHLISSFNDSNFVDCRISAFPYLKENILWAPDLIFIDLDRKDFKNELSFENALSTTLKNIKKEVEGFPTVLDTGGGYHIYQPVYCPTALENIREFNGFDKPSEQFLRFAKNYLSNGKADKQNNPSFRSCLLRIPGSINSKYNKKVQIIQKWDGIWSPITRDFIEEFRTYLIQKKIDEINYRQKISKVRKLSNNNNHNYYEWIDKKILANPFPDCRKLVVDLILAPYLINIKKMSYDESYRVIREWLDKCNSLKKLDNYQNFVNYRIHHALKTATQKGIKPMSLYKIKTDDRYRNSNLYHLILQNK